MITSGLQIIFTKSEVNFIQNLVFYIGMYACLVSLLTHISGTYILWLIITERAYRTPDFGIWECGTRYNDGTCELHASYVKSRPFWCTHRYTFLCFRSVGHVKAALEAINGFNLFGSGGTSGSIVYVDIDGMLITDSSN